MAQSAESRVPSLDGLRGISIVLVLMGHLAGTEGFPVSASVGNFWGVSALGVRIFFVISGFLITGLLLDEVRRSGRVALGRFYFRRTLRIFPPYYVFLAVMAAFAVAGQIDLAPRALLHTVTYTSNYYQDRSWYMGHTWSLSVEEQFYLLWPAALLVVGAARSAWVAGAVVLLVPMIRLVEWNFVPSAAFGVGHRFETIADALAIGCLLAATRALLHQTPAYLRLLESRAFAIVPLLALASGMLQDRPQIFFGAGISISNVMIALCIDWAVTFHRGRIGQILNALPLVSIGWISYSLYLWQQPFLNRSSDAWMTAFPQNLVATLVLAVSSYLLVERPALGLRKGMEKRIFAPTSGSRAMPGASAVPGMDQPSQPVRGYPATAETIAAPPPVA